MVFHKGSKIASKQSFDLLDIVLHACNFRTSETEGRGSI